MKRLQTTVLFSVAAACFLPVAAAGGETPSGGDGPRPPAAERSARRSIPPFYHPYADGLYSTVVSMNLFYAPKIEKKTARALNVEDQEEIKLKPKGFKKSLKATLVLQKKKRAPLAVAILGFDGRPDWPYARLLLYFLAEGGYHVLTFPSTYTIKFVDASRHGVSGNVTAETDVLVRLISEALKHKKLRDRVGRIGVVGISYGGIQALQLALRSKEGKLPFRLDGALALSPPVKLSSTTVLLDHYYKDDRWKYTMVELAKKFGSHVPVEPGVRIPFSPQEMRAAIGFVFRDGLKRVVERNDKLFKLRLLPRAGSGYNRMDVAEAWGFGKFIVDMAYPYWKKKTGLKSEAEFWAPTELRNLLPRLPKFAQAVEAADDPLNMPADLAEIRKQYKGPGLIVVPHGGHLGYLSSLWTRARIKHLFETFPPPRVLK